MVRRVVVPSLVVMAGLVGCSSDARHYDHGYSSWSERSYSNRYYAFQPRHQRPTLDLSDDEIEAALADHRTRETQRAAALAAAQVSAQQPAAATQTFDEAVRAVEQSYAVGSRDAADLVMAPRDDLFSWDRADQVVEISAQFRRSKRRSQLEVALSRRPGVTGDLAIAIPPGTYAAPLLNVGAGDERKRRWTTPEQQRRYRHWPPAQDLALLRAPVVRIPADRSLAIVRIPVACASFRIGAPRHGQPMTLDRFQPGSKIDRLMVALCAGPKAPSPDTQLAVWLARDDLAWNEFVAKGGTVGSLITFDRQRVLPRHGPGATRLLLEAGIDPRQQRAFFQVTTPAPAPEAAPEADPETWPELEEPEPAPLTPAPTTTKA